MSEQYHIKKYTNSEKTIAVDRGEFEEFVRVLTLLGVCTSIRTEVTPYEDLADIDITHTLVVY